MCKVPSKTRRNLVVAGAAGLATLAAPQAWQTWLAQPAAAQSIPPRTGEVKVQFAHRTGRWGIGANSFNTIPLEIHNQFGEGTEPVVHEVQIHFRLDHPSVKNLSAELISPDGHPVVLMNRPGGSLKDCSRNGVDITIVDTELENCCASIMRDVTPYCPEHSPSDVEIFFNTWKDRKLRGVYHTYSTPRYRLLPKFNGRPATGTWRFRVHNHLMRNVNKVIRQIDLTVYSRW